jgi:carbamoyl-phosphate synthase large subunit
MKAIGLETPRNAIAHSMEEALQVVDKRRLPLHHPSLVHMGGSGGGIAYNREEFEEICERGLELSPIKELLIDESLIGWKEYEMEVVRDRADNCIIICSIENFDADGRAYRRLDHRRAGADADRQGIPDHAQRLDRVLREIGVETGGSNVQFAVDPRTAAWS